QRRSREGADHLERGTTRRAEEGALQGDCRGPQGRGRPQTGRRPHPPYRGEEGELVVRQRRGAIRDIVRSSFMHGSMPPVGTSAPDRRHALLVLVCTSAPSFMLQLDANIVSVSLPSIARSLNASFEGIEWVITAYMLSFASLLLPAGALADRFGRKRLLIIGLAVFTLASFACGAAPNLSALI